MKPRTQPPPIRNDELRVIDAIVNRALVHFPDLDYNDIRMNIIATHLTCPLDLDILLNFDDLDFVHDIVGIERHLDHQTFALKDCFSPRSTKRKKP